MEIKRMIDSGDRIDRNLLLNIVDSLIDINRKINEYKNRQKPVLATDGGNEDVELDKRIKSLRGVLGI